jgi:hypothetical protein
MFILCDNSYVEKMKLVQTIAIFLHTIKLLLD